MRIHFALFTTLSLAVGCEIHTHVDDPHDGQPSSGDSSAHGDSTDNTATSEDPDTLLEQLAACNEVDFEPTPFLGPLFDPDTGVLVGELPPSYVVATTAGWPHNDPAAWEALDGRSEVIIQDVFTRAGYLGGSFGGSEACGSARTLTLWQDEATLMAFVLGSPHVDAFEILPTAILAWETTHWTAAGSEGVPTWLLAKQKLDEARTADRR